MCYTAKAKFFLTFDQFKKINETIRGEPEFAFYFDSDTEYMIIKYDDEVSFQRCGCGEEGSGEFFFPDLDTLYHAVTVDNICLKRDWERIELMYINDSFMLSNDMKQDLGLICERYHVDL